MFNYHEYRASGIYNPSSFLCFLLKFGCSTFYVECSPPFSVFLPHFLLKVQCSMFDVECSPLSSALGPLHLSRKLYKSTLFMQNKANLQKVEMNTSAYNIKDYDNLRPFRRRENKAKQSQFKPNFSPKLALFFSILALNRKEIVALATKLNLPTLSGVEGSGSVVSEPVLSEIEGVEGIEHLMTCDLYTCVLNTLSRLTGAILSLKSAAMIEAKQQKRKKTKHKNNPFTDFLVYVSLRVLVMFLYLFDVETNLRTACFLGRRLFKHYHRGRQRALENLRKSYPGHYGNFEIIGYLLGLFGFNVYSIARPLDNKFISKYLYGVRENAGQKIIDKKGASAMIDKLIKKGATMCFIADQDAGRKGIFVDFFGRKASTYKSIALLAITNNIPIGVGYSRRADNRFFFDIGIQRIIFPAEWQDKNDPIEWITAEYTKAIEDFVRDDPSQYWWLHRRWRHRPKEEKQ